jgi:hypothetical protein
MSHIQSAPERMYTARWLGPDGRERSRTFTRKAEAERHLAAVEVAKLSGGFPDQQAHLRRDRFHPARCHTTLTGAGLGSATEPKFSHLALRGFRWRICGSIFAAAVQDRLVASP